jgi:thiamine-monophosphate kinase
LTLKDPDEAWLAGFARGFGELAKTHGVALVGGNTTSGPPCISVQILGHAPRPAKMLRSGGKPGDVLFVTGTPGDSGGGLALELKKLSALNETDADHLRQRFHFPTPRVELGIKLRDYASACIDVSDGLFGDAGKLAQASSCGVAIEWERLPVSPQLVAVAGDTRARELSLSGGEDYELCFTVPATTVERLTRDLPPDRWGYTAIGVLKETPGALVTRSGTVMDFSHSGWDHFSS